MKNIKGKNIGDILNRQTLKNSELKMYKGAKAPCQWYDSIYCSICAASCLTVPDRDECLRECYKASGCDPNKGQQC